MAIQFTAFENLSVSTSSVSFTAATYDEADYALIFVDGGSVRCRFDATAPTASVGIQFDSGDYIELESNTEITRARFISEDGSTVTLHTNFGKQGGT